MNTFIREGTYPIDFVLDKFIIEDLRLFKRKRKRIDFHNILVKCNSQRYITFKNKGVKCISCGIVGSFFALEKSIDDGSSIDNNSYHFNLYAIVNGKEVLITKDHILPKSKGGANNLKNYQPMCEPCNSIKGNNYG